MAFKKCKNDGCEIQIEVRNTAEGWRPFEENGNKHNCQFSDYAKKQRAKEAAGPIPTTEYLEKLEQKNDHGNESSSPPISPKEYVERFVDYTAKGQQKVKFFIGTKDEVEEEYNGFRYVTQGKINVFGTQLAVDTGIIYFSLNYEEVKE